MLNVFITIDTEVWPRSLALRPDVFRREFERDVLGVTPRGSYGVEFQMDVLDEFGLKGVFFVEALFADVVGRGYLAEIVSLIRRRGHDVQLHLHAEWLQFLSGAAVPWNGRQYLRAYSADEQTALVARGLANLRACGAPDVRAFRAGNCAADAGTLAALRQNAVPFDTSYDECFVGARCDMPADGSLRQPRVLDGILEFPIACFRDRPGHLRHAQLAACSAGELQRALLDGWRRGWYAFVILSHSFELLRRGDGPETPARPDGVVIRRFVALCRFLAEHRDKFRTAEFAGLDPATVPIVEAHAAPASRPWDTAWRYVEQLTQRLT